MYKFAFELDTQRNYPILDKLRDSGMQELLVLPTANTLEKEPTYALDQWRSTGLVLKAWDYINKEMTYISGLYWVAGVYGLYNIDREKIYIGHSQQLRKRWNRHLTARYHGLRNELQRDLAMGQHFLFCVLESLETYNQDKRQLWWDFPLKHDKSRLRRAEQAWLDRLSKADLYNQRRACRA